MKGLLIKDLQLIKSQKQFFGAIVIISLFFTIYYENTVFIAGYMAVMLSMISVSTIAFDQNANGMSFLMTLPPSRSDYAKEKYLLMLLSTGASLAVSLLLLSIRFFMDKLPAGEGQLSGVLLTSILCTVLVQSVMIPLNLEFEGERSRIVFMVIMGAVYVIAFVSLSLIKRFHIDIDAMLQKADPVFLLIILFIILSAAAVISFLLSLRIMKKKEF